MPQEHKNYYKEFTDVMDTLGRRYDLARVFDDFLTVAVCSYHQTNIASRLQEKDEDNEDLYLKTIKPYSREELGNFAKLLGILQLSVYQEPYTDLLGKYFTEHITNGRNGQFFTPSSVCEMMARMQVEDPDNPPVGKGVYDPAAGSGRLLMAFAKVAPNNYFYANDVSISCAKMSAVNFFLHGMRGEVAAMNTLSMEFYKAWHINSPTLGIKPIDKEDSLIWTAPPKTPTPSSPDVKLPSEMNPSKKDESSPDKPSQLTLF